MARLPDDLDPVTRKRVEDVLSRTASVDPELLVDGQEEVFSRTEVETGRIEHPTKAGEGDVATAKGPTHAPGEVPQPRRPGDGGAGQSSF